MSGATRRVRAAARDARSNDDLVRDDFEVRWEEADRLDSPLDEETLDEHASTQLGPNWEPKRRDAN